jgi:hypothetical protein
MKCPSYLDNLQHCVLYLWVCTVLTVNGLNSVIHLIFVMVKCGVLFGVGLNL